MSKGDGTVKKFKNEGASYFDKLAYVESGNNPNARAKTSSASGLYQFTEGTWNGMNKKYNLGYTLNDRFNPEKAKKVIELFTRDNEKALAPVLGRDLNDSERYLGHLLGVSGAKKFLSTYKNNPSAPASFILPSRTLEANKSVFYDKSGRIKTLGEVYNWASQKMGKTVPKVEGQAVPNTFNNFNYGFKIDTPSFAQNTNLMSVPDMPEEPKKQEDSTAIEALKTQQREKDFLTEYSQYQQQLAQTETQAPQQTEELPNQVKPIDVYGIYNQASQFVETPIAQQGGYSGIIPPFNLNDYKKKTIQQKLEEVKNIQKDATAVRNYNDANKFSKTARNKTDKEIAQEREAKIQDSMRYQNIPFTKDNWREVLAGETKAIGDKLRVSNEPNFFDDYVNPAAMIGNMASNLGQAPLQAQQSDSYMPYVTSVGTPLAMGALAGLGANSTGQFVNNLVNPLAGIKTSVAPEVRQGLVSNGFQNILKKETINKALDKKFIPTFQKNLPEKVTLEETEDAVKLVGGNKTLASIHLNRSSSGAYPAMIRVDEKLWGNRTQDLLYNTAIEKLKKEGYEGLTSGGHLLSPLKTAKAHQRFNYIPHGIEGKGGVEVKTLTGHKNPNIEQEWFNNYQNIPKNFEKSSIRDVGNTLYNNRKEIGLFGVSVPTLLGMTDLMGIQMFDPEYESKIIKWVKEREANQNKQQGGIVKDQQGQRKFPFQVTEIQGDTMATDGYGNIPLYVVPDVGEPRVIMPNTGNHIFKGATKFTEYPITQDIKNYFNG